ncbi:hypothetical protein OIO90_004540 [Microbotryomycetes sp. JL221]|nr:hypothetical protein OIO90_004540 [Microbotryomycetes sp. JL221]
MALAAAHFDALTTNRSATLSTPAADKASTPTFTDSSGYSDTEKSDSPQETDQDAAPAHQNVEPAPTKQKRDWRPKSTWWMKQRSEMTWQEKLMSRHGIMHDAYYEKPPAGAERGPVPKHNVLREHLYILSRASFAPVVQQLYYWAFPGQTWATPFAWTVYWLSFTFFAIGCIYGVLDPSIGRDRVADKDIGQLTRGFFHFLIGRTLGEFILRWNKHELPAQNFNWDFPLRAVAFLIVMDYFFYVYHRSCHEIDFLWKIHSRHHQTKHPNPVLSILAGDIQEVIEISLVPLCAAMIVPMTFHETYLMICYCTYVEIFGHTGIRADWPLPIAGPVLAPFGLDLIIEDHDLHHRYGKSGRNYGKQTRVWDVIFGTTCPREEMANMPGHRAY